MAAKFEFITQYADDNDMRLPVRKTSGAAGYDFFVAEDIIIPSFEEHNNNIFSKILDDTDGYIEPLTLDEMAAVTKSEKAKPTLVPTGIKCRLDPGTYLELSVRSSCPLKYWLIMANGVGIIDQDYYNNSDNEGHIFFQIINLSPLPILLKKGDCIGQGIIKPYYKVEDDITDKTREGGFGSTDE
jgi:dUTP pyrophosphatase